MHCPACKLWNPDGAMRCDCGYDFQSQSIQASYLPTAQEKGVRLLVRNAFRTNGRFSNGEFATVFLGAHAVTFSLAVVTRFLEDTSGTLPAQILAALLAVVCLGWILFSIPLTICAGIRRLHDLDKSGWILLLAFLPCLNVIMILYLLIARGKPVGETRWG